MADINKNFKYYIDNQESLVEKYNGKFIVIVNQEVVGVYDDEPTAYFASIKEYGLGNFLLQQCLPGTDSYTQSFHSRVTFV